MSYLRPQFAAFSGAQSFPDPFLDIATASMPQSFSTALRWAEYIWLSNGMYREAMRRLIAYFITGVEFGTSIVGGSGDNDKPIDSGERDKWSDFLLTSADVLMNLQQAMENVREITEAGHKAQTQAFEVITKRIQENMAEMLTLFQRK